jgi:hypothetical protein
MADPLSPRDLTGRPDASVEEQSPALNGRMGLKTKALQLRDRSPSKRRRLTRRNRTPTGGRFFPVTRRSVSRPAGARFRPDSSIDRVNRSSRQTRSWPTSCNGLLPASRTNASVWRPSGMPATMPPPKIFAWRSPGTGRSSMDCCPPRGSIGAVSPPLVEPLYYKERRDA